MTTVSSRISTAVVAGFVGYYAFFDNSIVAPVVIGLVVAIGWVLGSLVSLALLCVVSLACTRWMLRRWDEWMAGSGERLERKAARLRHGRVMRHPMRWIARGSTLSFVVAGALLGLLVPSAVFRIASGRDPARRQLVAGSLGYAVCTAAIYTAAGYGIAVAAGTA